MEDSIYNFLHGLPKSLNERQLSCAPYGKQAIFWGRGTLRPSEKFRVVQNRKGHRRGNNLTYILFHKQNNIMIRIDINGQEHKGIETPHVHIFDNQHSNGKVAIPLSEIKNYNVTDDVILSLHEFLKYNQFGMDGVQISPSTV